MSEVMAVYSVQDDVDQIAWTFETMDQVIDWVKNDLDTLTLCPGDSMIYTVRCEEMEQSEFEALEDPS